MEYAHLKHIFGPVYDEHSEILILGSFPSVKSREISFYYGHPQNRFWSVLEAVFGEKAGSTTEEKRAFLLKNRIALWDVIDSCDIIGSSDSSIKNVKPVDITAVLDNCRIKQIFINGRTAAKLFEKYLKLKTGIEATVLPSTSPANAAYNLEKLIDVWKVIRK
jgi:TDG/mug DNA glycosylase family protein